mmetsp:Transcript_22437/g.62294  ORF Transcript_22437/g.62294 Transcript_22437/m.62294 type:complete len:222 (+) Transcript_22437:266-931(+)
MSYTAAPASLLTSESISSNPEMLMISEASESSAIAIPVFLVSSISCPSRKPTRVSHSSDSSISSPSKILSIVSRSLCMSCPEDTFKSLSDSIAVHSEIPSIASKASAVRGKGTVSESSSVTTLAPWPSSVPFEPRRFTRRSEIPSSVLTLTPSTSRSEEASSFSRDSFVSLFASEVAARPSMTASLFTFCPSGCFRAPFDPSTASGTTPSIATRLMIRFTL